MAQKVVVELHSEGFRTILMSNGCENYVSEVTKRVYNNIGSNKSYFREHTELLYPGTNGAWKMKHPEHSGRWVGFIDTLGQHPNYGDYLEYKYKILSKAVR